MVVEIEMFNVWDEFVLFYFASPHVYCKRKLVPPILVLIKTLNKTC